MSTSGYVPPSILPTPTYLTAAGSLLGKPAADTPPDEPSPLPGNAKMFVGGLPQSVTQDTLREYFERFGLISEAFVLIDEGSGRSRGFGFVTFDNPTSLQAVLSSRPHFLDGKQVDCKHAVLKGQGETMKEDPPSTGSWGKAQPQPRPTPYEARPEGGEEDDDDLFLTGGGKSYLALSGDRWLEDCAEADERKIFVGGLPDVTPAEFASFFEHFGPVADAMVMFDRKRRRQRGFGFITFATNEGVTKALEHNRHPVKGKLVEVKKAHPLVLQKARAPARRERDQAQQRASPSLTSAKRKASEAAPPWAANRVAPLTNSNDAWLQIGKKLKEDRQVDPFAELNSAAAKSKFPGAPWHQDVDASRRPWGRPEYGATAGRYAAEVAYYTPYGGTSSASYGGGTTAYAAAGYMVARDPYGKFYHNDH